MVFKSLLFTTIILCLVYLLLTSIINNPTGGYLNSVQLKDLGFTGYQQINPNLEIYPLKRYSENIIHQSAFKLYQTRFEELVFILNYDKTGFLLETVDRYNSSAGKLKTVNIKDPNFKTIISQNLKLLERLRDRYHFDSPYWGKIEQAVDVTKSLI